LELEFLRGKRELGRQLRKLVPVMLAFLLSVNFLSASSIYCQANGLTDVTSRTLSSEVIPNVTPQPISAFQSLVLQAGANQAYFVYADPNRMTRAEATYDVASGSTVYGMCLNIQNQAFDNSPLIVSQSAADRGRLLVSGQTVLMFGGPNPHLCVHYLEQRRLTPVYFAAEPEGDGTHLKFVETSTGIARVDRLGSSIDFEHEDYFVIMALTDEGGNHVLVCYGFDWKGTWSGGMYLKAAYSTLPSYTNSYYLLHWVDTNGDGIPQTGEMTQIAAPASRVYGLDFSPFTENGQNPDQGTIVSEQQIRQLMTTVQPYTTWVRTFGCSNGLQVAGRIAHEMGLKIAVGVWLSGDATTDQNEITRAISIANAGQADMLIVGSETLEREVLTETQLVTYINQVKSAVQGIPVATADTYGQLLAHPTVMAAGDVVLPNIYPYWEGINLTYAISFLNSRYQEILSAAGTKPVIISETGWPTAGGQVGEALPSAENAAYYFLNFESWANARNASSFYFEAFDEPWKTVQEGAVGAHWGIWDNAQHLKAGVQSVFDGATVPDNWSGLQVIGGAGVPSIRFTYVPPIGSYATLKGDVTHVRPADFKVTVFIKVGGWYNKPTWDSRLTDIPPDGSWTCNITTGGTSDTTATEIAAYLVPVGYTPPRMAGEPTLPVELDTHAVAKCQVVR
jgi:exo-beta-1,3-glucanase (GH17 family)